MRQVLVPMIAVFLVATLQLAHAQTTPGDDKPPLPFDAVLVTGEQPGPGLWKVSKEDHVLWILGTTSPLPKKMTWRSREVEAVIKESQAVFGGRQVTGHVQDREGARELREFAFNPKGTTVKDRLPSKVYEKFSALNAKYADGDDDFERYRPFVAVQELYKQSLRNAQLSSDGAVGKTVQRLAKKYKVTYRRIDDKFDDQSKFILTEWKAVSHETEIACVDAWLDRFDRDISETKVEANAWAIGDIELLRKNPYLYESRQTAACSNFFSASPRLRELVAENERRWYEELDRALDQNKSTLAVMSIRELLSPNGAMAKFRAKGYTVDEP